MSSSRPRVFKLASPRLSGSRCVAAHGFEDGEYLRVLRDLPQSPLLMMELEQSEAWCERFGMRFLFPFFDREVIDLALRIRPETLYANGLMKAPLRRVVQRGAPSLSLPSKKVDFTLFGNELLRRCSGEALHSMGGLRHLAREGIIAPRAAQRWFDEYTSGGRGSALRAWRLLSAEAWLRANGTVD